MNRLATTRRGKNWLYLIALLSAALRLPALFTNTFHPDEALFATWARLIAIWQDPLLLTQQVDKPPLMFYLQALFYPLQGPVEWAARLPSFIASLLLVPLVAILAQRLYRDDATAVVASLFVALSPFAIQFSATAFLDPLLVALLVASLVIMARGIRPGYARWTEHETKAKYAWTSGTLFGLAVATKYHAWLFLPLLLAAALMLNWRRAEFQRWLSGFLPILGAYLLWEAVRTNSSGLWPAQLANIGGLRLAWSSELWPRLQQLVWLAQWLVPLPVYLSLPLLRMRRRSWPGRRFDLIWVCFLFGYLIAHWLVAVPLWDRYLLPVVPFLALLLARATMTIAQALASVPSRGASQPSNEPGSGTSTGLVTNRWRLGHILGALFVLILLPFALRARVTAFPIGGHSAADQGAAQVASMLQDAPYGTVLYDHWYSWQWRYHLLDRRVYVSWFPNPAALVEDLDIFADDVSARYVALPRSPAALPVKRAISQAGFQLHAVPAPGDSQIDLYRILAQGRA